MEHVTGRSTARRKKHAKKDRRTTADLGQVLRMTPTKGSRETLATATALQRTRAAALRRDREAALAAERDGRVSEHPSVHERILASGCKHQVEPPVTWTTEEDTENTDADEEMSDDEEKYEADEKTYEDDERSKDAATEAAAIAAADDDDTSLIQTPEDARCLEPTQSDVDFIATDEEPAIETDDPDYYPSTEEDDDTRRRRGSLHRVVELRKVVRVTVIKGDDAFVSNTV